MHVSIYMSILDLIGGVSTRFYSSGVLRKLFLLSLFVVLILDFEFFVFAVCLKHFYISFAPILGPFHALPVIILFSIKVCHNIQNDPSFVNPVVCHMLQGFLFFFFFVLLFLGGPIHTLLVIIFFSIAMHSKQSLLCGLNVVDAENNGADHKVLSTSFMPTKIQVILDMLQVWNHQLIEEASDSSAFWFAQILLEQCLFTIQCF
jgi:hypothetical protein